MDFPLAPIGMEPPMLRPPTSRPPIFRSPDLLSLEIVTSDQYGHLEKHSHSIEPGSNIWPYISSYVGQNHQIITVRIIKEAPIDLGPSIPAFYR
jgi:hypothetical protein